MQLPLNKRKSQSHGGKRKPSVNKRRAHATDSEESDYESSLPSNITFLTSNFYDFMCASCATIRVNENVTLYGNLYAF